MNGETQEEAAPQWLLVGSLAKLKRRQRLVLKSEPDDIVVWWYDERPHALRNICIHSARELVGGSLLGGRLVCPGHQWAFELGTGYCKERDRYQPTYETRIEGDQVYVNISPAVRDASD